MNLIQAFLVTLLLAVSSPAYAKVNLDAEAALVTVLTNDGEDSYQCSGSHVGDGVILTAAHCVMDQITVYDGVVFKPVTALLWIDRAYDVALLYSPDMSLSPSVDFDCREQPIGTEIEAVGVPYGFRDVHTYGRIASRPVKIPGKRASWGVGQFVTAIIEGGMSGGMALDADGSQVGVLVGGYGNLGIIVPASTVCGLLNDQPSGSHQ
jgi:S1-C subfamily serine protease